PRRKRREGCTSRIMYLHRTDVPWRHRIRERMFESSAAAGGIISSMAGGVRIRVAVCLTRDGRMLLVQHEKTGRRYWLLPGGGLERGETIARCAAREVEEETGYRVQAGRLVHGCEAMEPGGRHMLSLVYAGRIAAGSLGLGG